MKTFEIVNLKCIDWFIHPFRKNEVIDYRSQFQNSKKILVLYPTIDPQKIYPTLILHVIKLFDRDKITSLYLNVDQKQLDLNNENKSIIYLDIKRQNLLTFTRSETLNKLSREKFDVLIDLNPEFSLLNIFLGRMLKIPLRICFEKPYSDQFYNLQYLFQSHLDITKNVQKLILFLQSHFFDKKSR